MLNHLSVDMLNCVVSYLLSLELIDNAFRLCQTNKYIRKTIRASFRKLKRTEKFNADGARHALVEGYQPKMYRPVDFVDLRWPQQMLTLRGFTFGFSVWNKKSTVAELFRVEIRDKIHWFAIFKGPEMNIVCFEMNSHSECYRSAIDLLPGGVGLLWSKFGESL